MNILDLLQQFSWRRSKQKLNWIRRKLHLLKCLFQNSAPCVILLWIPKISPTDCTFHLSPSNNRCSGFQRPLLFSPMYRFSTDTYAARQRSLFVFDSIAVRSPPFSSWDDTMEPKAKCWHQSSRACRPSSPMAPPGTHGCIYTPTHNISADHSVEHCDTQLSSLGRFDWPENAGGSITG